MQIYKVTYEPYNLLSPFFVISRNIYLAFLHTTRSLRCHHHRVLLDCQLVSTSSRPLAISRKWANYLAPLWSENLAERERGGKKCILGAPTIVPSLGSRIWLRETTRAAYTTREPSQAKGTNGCSGQYHGMEWNGTE